MIVKITNPKNTEQTCFAVEYIITMSIVRDLKNFLNLIIYPSHPSSTHSKRLYVSIARVSMYMACNRKLSRIYNPTALFNGTKPWTQGKRTMRLSLGFTRERG